MNFYPPVALTRQCLVAVVITPKKMKAIVIVRKTISVNIAIQEELEEIQKKCKKVKQQLQFCIFFKIINHVLLHRM